MVFLAPLLALALSACALNIGMDTDSPCFDPAHEAQYRNTLSSRPWLNFGIAALVDYRWASQLTQDVIQVGLRLCVWSDAHACACASCLTSRRRARAERRRHAQRANRDVANQVCQPAAHAAGASVCARGHDECRLGSRVGDRRPLARPLVRGARACSPRLAEDFFVAFGFFSR